MLWYLLFQNARSTLSKHQARFIFLCFFKNRWYQFFCFHFYFCGSLSLALIVNSTVWLFSIETLCNRGTIFRIVSRYISFFYFSEYSIFFCSRIERSAIIWYKKPSKNTQQHAMIFQIKVFSNYQAITFNVVSSFIVTIH